MYGSINISIENLNHKLCNTKQKRLKYVVLTSYICVVAVVCVEHKLSVSAINIFFKKVKIIYTYKALTQTRFQQNRLVLV